MRFTTDVATAFIEPGSPWQNGYSESFNGRFRDELLTTEQFNTLLEAQVLADDWRTDYNTIRPHGSLGGLTPTQFRAQWIEQPTLGNWPTKAPKVVSHMAWCQ